MLFHDNNNNNNNWRMAGWLEAAGQPVGDKFTGPSNAGREIRFRPQREHTHSDRPTDRPTKYLISSRRGGQIMYTLARMSIKERQETIAVSHSVGSISDRLLLSVRRLLSGRARDDIHPSIQPSNRSRRLYMTKAAAHPSFRAAAGSAKIQIPNYWGL